RRHRLGSESADYIIEPIRGRVYVRIVNLIRITGKDDLGAVSHASDDGFGFQRSEVLSLVNDHELIGDAAATNVTQSFHHNAPGAHQVSTASVFMAHV